MSKFEYALAKREKETALQRLLARLSQVEGGTVLWEFQMLSGLATVKEDNFWSYAHLLIFVFLTIWLLTSKEWHTIFA